jgi:hypothetical protein
LLQRCERVRRRLPAVEHPLINQVVAEATPAELGDKTPWAIAGLRITAARRAGGSARPPIWGRGGR